jgi:hypothetical protein
MTLPVPPNERVRVTFKWMTHAPLGTVQPVRVRLDDRTFDVRLPRPDIAREQTFEVMTTKRLLDIHFEVPPIKPHTPNERDFGIALIAARVQRVSDAHADEAIVAARTAPILDSWISFVAGAPGSAFLTGGWSWSEDWGTWSDDYQAELSLPAPRGQRLRLALKWFATAKRGPPSVRVHVDDRPYDVAFPAIDQEIESTFDLTSQRDWVTVRIEIERPVASGGRLLGVGLKAARITLQP